MARDRLPLSSGNARYIIAMRAIRRSSCRRRDGSQNASRQSWRQSRPSLHRLSSRYLLKYAGFASDVDNENRKPHKEM